MKTLLVSLAVALAFAGCAYAQDTLSGTLFVTPGFTLTATNGASVVSETVGRVLAQATTYGTNGTVAAPQMNAWVSESFTVAGAGERVFSFDAMTNRFGDVAALWRVNLLIVHRTGEEVGAAVSVGNAENHVEILGATNHTAAVAPGGIVMATAPDAVGVASTGKVLRISNSGTNSATVALYIGGAR
jgi:hypothetical protein